MLSLNFLNILSVIFTKRLSFNHDNRFKIIQITDIHYGESDYPEQDANTTILMRKLIEWEQPDLAILTGDMVSGYEWDK